MKQIVQNYKKGSLTIEEVPEPALKAGGVLVQTYHSLISAGTEKMKVDDSKRSYVGMAKARPEKARQVMETLKQAGPLATYRKVMNRLDAYSPLGYSLAGKVIEAAADVSEFEAGDMVTCAGNTANHAEINWIPVNLCCKISALTWEQKNDGKGSISTDWAAFTTVGAIAMQGVRQADVHVGECVAVIGLGLVGLLSCLILRAAGCRVMGVDIDPTKVELALKMGVDIAGVPEVVDIEQMAMSFSGGYGADSILVTTGTKSNEPTIMAGNIARDRATVVDVGINKMDIPWQLYFEKELTVKHSRSYGPGRYDPNYELNGQDYPIGYVRWTEKRNMISFLDLMASGRINIGPLITHKFSFSNANEAYKLLEDKGSELYVGILLKYDVSKETLKRSRIRTVGTISTKTKNGLNVGMIGAGNFARTMLLPNLKCPDVDLIGIATATGISAKDTARKFDFDICTTDYNELLDNKSINTIMIATRHNLHGKLVMAALKAGKHVYTEKPLCLNEEELKEIASLYNSFNATESRPLLMVGFNRRFAPLVKDMKAFFEKRNEPMVMHYRINAGYKEKSDWYQDRTVGGGRIIGEVCHFIDTLQFLTDALPVSVFAQAIKTDNQAITVEDNVAITIRFSDGSVGSITYLANGDPLFPKEYVDVFCENRVSVLDNFTKLTTMAQGKKKLKKAILQDKGHKAEMKALINCVNGNGVAPISFKSIFATTLATFKIHDSIKNQRMVPINNLQ